MKATIDEVRQALYDLMATPGNSITAKKILRKAGSETISGLKKKKYAKVIKACKKAMTKEKKGDKA